ncbi:MAG: hypothetical protein SNJ84_03810 [Verrucomicrobiia bacterium]
MQYDVYHDESKEAGYWHGILFVPRSTRQVILAHLATVRLETDFNFPLSLKEVKSCGNRFQCSRAVVQLAVNAMMQDTKGKVEKVLVSSRTGDPQQKRQATAFREIIRVDQALGLKLIVFRERDGHKLLAPILDYGAKVETTFRMGFKGGLHLLFDEDHPITVSSIHFDGHEHHRRHIDKNRIIGKLKPGLRPYCQIPDGVLVDDRHGVERQADAQGYDDFQFLQIADLLIGSFRTVLGEKKRSIQAEVASPAAEVVKKWKAGPARMKNSRWHRAFCISECYLENGQWQFAPLPANDDANQAELPLS